MATDRGIMKMLDECRRQGAIVSMSGHCHYKVIPPDKSKPIVYTSSTPGDVRTIQNVKARLRRSGFKLI